MEQETLIHVLFCSKSIAQYEYDIMHFDPNGKSIIPTLPLREYLKFHVRELKRRKQI